MNKGGTVTSYRCSDCGGEWTYRNTQDGFNEYARTNRNHDGKLTVVGAGYVGRHRLALGGVSVPMTRARAIMRSNTDVLRDLGLLDTPFECTVVPAVDPAVPYDYHVGPLGIIPGAPWFDGRRPLMLHTDEGPSE